MIKRYLTIIVFLFAFFLSACSIQGDKNNGTSLLSGDQYSLQDIERHIQSQSQKDPESLYEEKKNITNLYLLIDYLLSDFQYEKAVGYYQQLMNQTQDRDRARLLKIMVNNLHAEPGYYLTVRKFLDSYILSGTIGSQDAIYYGLTLDLLQEKFNKDSINLLSGEYTDFKNLLRKQYDLYYSYKDAPDYYLYALFAVAYFKYQEYGVAKSLADMAIAKDPNYILPYQIKAYVGLLTKQFDFVKQSLDTLIQLDSQKIERYQFLLGLMYYNQNDSTQAKTYFLQMKSPILKLEGLRYLIELERKEKKQHIDLYPQSNKQLDEYDKNIIRYQEELFLSDSVRQMSDKNKTLSDSVGQNGNNVGQIKKIDFQTVFDRYIYDRLWVGSGGLEGAQKLYLSYPDILNTSLDMCFQILTGEEFICNYGRAGKLILENKHKEAIRLLIPLVKKYPQWQTFYIIGLMYKDQGLLENAKLYFGRALQYIDNNQKDELSSMMLDMLNQSTNQSVN